MNFLSRTLAHEDLRDCTLITKNGTRITASIESIEYSGDAYPRFEGFITGIKESEPKLSYEDYCRKDLELQRSIYRNMLNSMYGIKTAEKNYIPEIKNVIFNDPATIVFWDDGTKTVVKCQPGDRFDPEKGLAMAIAKKAYGNRGSYCNQLKKWLPKPKKQMTFREEVAKKEPERINVIYRGGVAGCPRDKNVNKCYIMNQVNCTKCWDRMIPDELMDND